MTKAKAYTSTQPVDLGEEGYHKAGEVFVTAKPQGKTWEPVSTKEKAAIEASQPLAGDPPLEGLQLAALQAIAVERKVNPKGLDKQGLIDAIKAADDPTR